MGRKINTEGKPKKGLGRKARKQKDPVFDQKLLKGDIKSGETKKLSHRQKNRALKRSAKQQQSQKTKEKKSEATADAVAANADLQNCRKKYGNATKKAPKTTNGSSATVPENANPRKRKNLDILADGSDSSDEDAPEPAGNGRLDKFLDDDDDDSSDMNSESADDDSPAMSDDSEDGEDDEDMLPIEQAGKKLKKKIAENDRIAAEEMDDLMSNKEKFTFPEDEHTENLQDLHMRIKEVIGVLSDFSANRDQTRSRVEYVNLLVKDLCTYYSYNDFLMQTLVQLFPPSQLLEFLEASEVQRPLTIRTNSLKTRRRDLAQALINRGVNLDPIGKWSKEGLVVYNSQIPLGATPEYLTGHYMIQGASSMLPVMALAPEEHERILDLCAAPGGKSSHIAALMKNTGVLFANDVNKERLQAVVGNFHRLGVQNAIVTSVDGTKYSSIMTGFDRVLLDAPCTGTGVISKDLSVKNTKTEIDVQRCYNLQRKLILTAIDCLSATSETGGFLVYSTCSLLPQENEWVIDYALRKRNVRLVSTGLDFGSEGMVNFAGQKYHPSMKLTRRFYPHTYNMDGFFVAKLQKFSDVIPNQKPDVEEPVEPMPESEDLDIATKSPKKKTKRDRLFSDKQEKRLKESNHITKTFQKPIKTAKKAKSGSKVQKRVP